MEITPIHIHFVERDRAFRGGSQEASGAMEFSLFAPQSMRLIQAEYFFATIGGGRLRLSLYGSPLLPPTVAYLLFERTVDQTKRGF